LLLDEVGEMPLALQAKLLRLLQEGTYRRLGDSEEKRADLRIIAVTNADLQAHIAAGRFRQDLFYRLSAYQLQLPPLRDRREDIDPLIALTVKRYVSDDAKLEDVFDDEVLRILRRYSWYGNVRELEAVTKQLATMARHLGRVSVRMLPPEFRGWAVEGGCQGCMELAAYVEQAERDCISRALVDTKGNRTEAARLLGISRNTIYKKMERLGIRFPT
jgi:transcriptional regulator with PAS, ATPase and Fis domain